MAKASAVTSRGMPASSDPSNTQQWAGFERAQAHRRDQRATLLGTKHGTVKSKRGVRIRVNAEIRRNGK